MSYQVCGHCRELLSEKTLKEHHRLYSDNVNGCWIKVTTDSDESRMSSPLCVSPPGTRERDSLCDVESLELGEAQTPPSSDEEPVEGDRCS